MGTNLKKIDYKNKKVFVGLDVHQKTWHSTSIFEELIIKKSFPADAQAFAKYLQNTFPNAHFEIAYEAGCFGFWIKEQLETLLDATVSVLNPADIPSSGKDKTNKTDARDSLKIAKAIKANTVKSIFYSSKESQEHRDLYRRRADLVKKQTRVKNQIKSKLKFYGKGYPEEYEDSRKHWSKGFLRWLKEIQFTTAEGNYIMSSLLRELEFVKEEIKLIANELSNLMKQEKYREDIDIIIGIPGIGKVSAAAIMLEIVDIHRFKEQDHFTSYLGLAPTEHSSGEHQSKGHITRRCNRLLRTIFIEAAWTAIRLDPAIQLYFAECLKRMTKPKAIVKVARKLANRLRYLLKTKTKYVKGVVA